MNAFGGDATALNHTILLDEDPGPEGYGVRCLPHGPLGFRPSLALAYVLACEHDDEYGKDWL